MENMTMPGKVSERVDALSQNSHDKPIPVPEIAASWAIILYLTGSKFKSYNADIAA